MWILTKLYGRLYYDCPKRSPTPEQIEDYRFHVDELYGPILRALYYIANATYARLHATDSDFGEFEHQPVPEK